MKESQERIQEVAYRIITDRFDRLDGRRILEVGCGDGSLSRKLARAGATVTALDRTPPEGVDGVVESSVIHDLGTGTLPFADESFDCVVATEVMEHLRAPFLVLSAMVRVLRKKGLLVLTLPNYWNVKYRVRYLFTGSLARPFLGDDLKREAYHEGYAPHINTITFPTLHNLLTWENCEEIEVRSGKRLSWVQTLRFAPWYGLVRIANLFRSGNERQQLLMGTTNGPSVLLGRNAALAAVKKASRW